MDSGFNFDNLKLPVMERLNQFHKGYCIILMFKQQNFGNNLRLNDFKFKLSPPDEKSHLTRDQQWKCEG